MSKESSSFSDEKTGVVAAGEKAADPALYIEPAEEAKLLRKLDAWIISIMGALYLLAFLDRGNIGNANVAGLSTDLGLVGNQYGAAVSVVYSTYVVFEPIYANLLKIVGPRNLMACSTLAWGLITLGTTFVKSFDHLVAARVLLGAFEAGLFPCINMYLAMSYRREELARRLSYIFSAAALSGAFGGLLAFGLTRIDAGPLRRWQYLYLVEGCISLAFAPIAYMIIPNTLDKAWFLNKREQELCAIRYEINKDNFDPSETFSWKQVRLAAKDWKTWSHAVNQFCVNVTLYGLTTFMPTIVKGLGLTTDTVYVQLLTVPVYVVGAASFITGARLSDFYQNRSIPLVVYMIIAIIGYVILATVESAKVRYFGVYVVGVALYAGSGLNVTWTNNNNAGHYRRATATGLMQLIGNSAGAAIGFIFSADTAPGYHKGLWVSVGVSVLSVCITTFHALALIRINRQRRALVAAGAPNQPELGSDNPHFVFIL